MQRGLGSDKEEDARGRLKFVALAVRGVQGPWLVLVLDAFLAFCGRGSVPDLLTGSRGFGSWWSCQDVGGGGCHAWFFSLQKDGSVSIRPAARRFSVDWWFSHKLRYFRANKLHE